ncbi:MAG: pyridoxal-dependent decarboxylase [Cyclobacteriaceae bacterium]|jgi:glutamate/tyrosine decarboxylase-like PLP-dependent enzyme|nr:pyridoxal-dependent decarboxylase [Cyclobacteriaceae bacterium]
MHQNFTPESELNNLSALIELTRTSAIERYTTIRESNPGILVNQLKQLTLTENGIGTEKVFDFFKQEVVPHLHAGAGPRYLGFVTGGSTPASMIGDFLTSIYDQNSFGYNDTAAPIIENQALTFLKEILGLSTSYFGTFVTGATQSNFVSLAIARQWCGKQKGINVAQEGLSNLKIKIVGSTPHSSAYKSISMLGLGKQNIDVIGTLPNREKMDVNALQNYLIENKESNIIVLASSGTVNTGDFDDLVEIAALKKQFNFWLHVDGAFGAFTACSPKHAHLINGINNADSVTVDAHKWLNVPYDCAMQFTKHIELQAEVFQNSGTYLATQQFNEFFHYTPENSRRWRGLPTWFSLLAYGKNGVKKIIENNCTLAYQLGEWIKQSNHYQLLSPVHLNIVCFTLLPESSKEKIKQWLDAVRDDGHVFFTPTVYQGKPAIRAAFSNWMTNSDDLHVIQQTLEKFAAKNRASSS